MKQKLQTQRGISIIGALFTLIILGIFGATIVVMVSAEHETRVGQLSQDWAFYNVQAGLECALKEVDKGGYPVGSVPFGQGNFTVVIAYKEYNQVTGKCDYCYKEVKDLCEELGICEECSFDSVDDCIIVTGNVGNVSKRYLINHYPFGADCLDVNIDDVALTGINQTDIEGIKLQKIYADGGLTLDNIRLDKIKTFLDPFSGEEAAYVEIKGVEKAIIHQEVWEDDNDDDRGTIIDIEDTVISGSEADAFLVRFNSNMSGKTDLKLIFYMTDQSCKTVPLDALTIP